MTLGAVRHLVAAHPVGTKTGGTLVRVRTSGAEQEQRCTLTLKAGDVAGLAAEATGRTADIVDAVSGYALLVLGTWAAGRSGRGAIPAVAVFAGGAGRGAAAEPAYTIRRLALLCGITRIAVWPGQRARPEVPRDVTELTRRARKRVVGQGAAGVVDAVQPRLTLVIRYTRPTCGLWGGRDVAQDAHRVTAVFCDRNVFHTVTVTGEVTHSHAARPKADVELGSEIKLPVPATGIDVDETSES